jgi:hypothetical protein
MQRKGNCGDVFFLYPIKPSLDFQWMNWFDYKFPDQNRSQGPERYSAQWGLWELFGGVRSF